ncbi:hypothetical protein HDU80_006850 [Chytriomyces hyalinus]|nr:hypothetical protein HDU80_006850 [Chytriomyces hyalinus]
MESAGTFGQSSSNNSGNNHHHHHHHHHHNDLPSRDTIVIVQPPVRVAPMPTRAVPSQMPAQSPPQLLVVQNSPPRESPFLSCWQVVLILGTFWFFITTVPMPFSQSIAAIHGDRILVSLSGYWLNSVTLQGLSTPTEPAGAKAYLFETEPRLGDIVMLPTRTIQPILKGGNYHSIRYDLYPGSEVNLDWSFQSNRFGPNVLVLRGEESFQMFRNGDLQDVPREDRLIEKYHSNFGQLNLKITSRSEYHFIFYMAEPGATSQGSANFHVTSRTLSLSNPPPIFSSDKHCPERADAQSLCTVPLISNGGYAHLDEYFLVVVAPVHADYGDMIRVSMSKKARWGKYGGAVLRSLLVVIVFGGFVGRIWKRLMGLTFCNVPCRSPRFGYQPVAHENPDHDSGGASGNGIGQPQAFFPAEAPPPYSITSNKAPQNTAFEASIDGTDAAGVASGSSSANRREESRLS